MEQKGIKILDVIKLSFYSNQIKLCQTCGENRMWKKMGSREEETRANKGGLLTFLDIEWNELDHENLVEFQNIFLLKGMKFILGGEV